MLLFTARSTHRSLRCCLRTFVEAMLSGKAKSFNYVVNDRTCDHSRLTMLFGKHIRWRNRGYFQMSSSLLHCSACCVWNGRYFSLTNPGCIYLKTVPEHEAVTPRSTHPEYQLHQNSHPCM